jgi:hypothetical protein
LLGRCARPEARCGSGEGWRCARLSGAVRGIRWPGFTS